MRLVAGFVCLLVVTSASAVRSETSGTCASEFTVPADAGMRLAVYSKPAEVDLVGTDAREIRVTCRLDDSDDSARAHEVHIRFAKDGGTGHLSITGGPSNNVHITIEIPHQTHLSVRMPAGAIHVKDVTGDKDLDVHAGELTVTGVNPQEYRTVEASVEIGEVKASEYDVDKGGFFRSFKKFSADGLYRLDAHIITGSIKLN
jgi:hypothetical protein